MVLSPGDPHIRRVRVLSSTERARYRSAEHYDGHLELHPSFDLTAPNIWMYHNRAARVRNFVRARPNIPGTGVSFFVRKPID
jgi:hypothetical protein